MVVGALGAGGGILAVPVLVYLLGQEPHAAATSSLVVVGLTALAGLPHRVRTRHVDWRTGLTFGALTMVGAVGGSRLSTLVPGDVLMVLFGLLLAGVAVVMLRSGVAERRAAPITGAPAHEPPPGRRRPYWTVVVAALVTGVLTGFFGVGGGFAVVPVLVLLLAVPIRVASGTSLVVLILASASGLVAREMGGLPPVDWPVTLAFAAASMVGGAAGGPLAGRVRSSTLTVAFGVLLALVAVATLAERFWGASD